MPVPKPSRAGRPATRALPARATQTIELELPLSSLGRCPLPARFVDRPNRFVARVRLPDGAAALAHVANSGRLTGTLVPGCKVLVDGPFPPPRSVPYSLLAAQESGTWVCAVTPFANRLFRELWSRGLFPELAAGSLRAEVAHGRSRFDFLAGETWVEVKSVTLCRGGVGLFPDAVTARGARHARELAALARKGVRSALVFVAQRGDVSRIAPEDDVDPEFGRALRSAAAAGVQILASSVEFGLRGALAARRVPVDLAEA